MAYTIETPYVKEVAEKMVMMMDFHYTNIMPAVMLVNTAMIDWFKARTWDRFPGHTLAYLKVVSRMFAAVVLFEYLRHKTDGSPVWLERIPDGDEEKLADRKILKWQKFINQYCMKMENNKQRFPLVAEPNDYSKNQGMDFAYSWQTAEQLQVWVKQMSHYIILETGLDAKQLLEMYERQAWCDGSCTEPCS
jgi:hypothetical protein